MKNPLRKVPVWFVLAALGALGTFPTFAQVSVAVGVQISAPTDFYTPLAPDGTWVNYGSYGQCWHPSGVAVDWQPYCNGSWVWTDCGWYWQSDDSWAWACYHYGSWAFAPAVGWVWIPGTVWAPAWVTWRMGGDHIGWAPCGPGGAVAAPAAFVFVDSHHFNGPITRSALIVNNTTIINQTKVYGGPRTETHKFGSVSQRVAVNNGPGLAAVEKATGRKFTAQPVQNVDRQTRAPENLRAPGKAEPERALPPAARTEPKAAPGPLNRENVRTPESDQPLRRPADLPPGDNVQREPQHEVTPPQRDQDFQRMAPDRQPSPTPETPREVPPAKNPNLRPAPAPTSHPVVPTARPVAPQKASESPKGEERPAPDKDKDHQGQ